MIAVTLLRIVSVRQAGMMRLSMGHLICAALSSLKAPVGWTTMRWRHLLPLQIAKRWIRVLPLRPQLNHYRLSVDWLLPALPRAKSQFPNCRPIFHRLARCIAKVGSRQHHVLPLRTAFERYLRRIIIQAHHQFVRLLIAHLQRQLRPFGCRPLRVLDFVRCPWPFARMVREPFLLPSASEGLDHWRRFGHCRDPRRPEFPGADQMHQRR